ncbi:MAG: hypothetical protein HG456_002115 [candidate division SR1 bacterium]|nr:hypothetical protein [candidate division SR1 bacterium]
MFKNRIKIGLFSSIFLLSRFGNSFLFASDNISSTTSSSPKCGPNAPICLQTPSSLNLYLEFQQKAIDLMSADPFKTTTAQINDGEGGLFTNKVLKLSSPTANTSLPLITDLAKELETAITNMLIGNATTSALFLLSTLNTQTDGLMSFLILFQERPLVRDRAKLQNIDRDISETIYILGQKGKIGKTIENSEKLQSLISRYQSLGLLDKNYNLPSSISYLDTLLELQSLNISIKTFLSSSSTYKLTNSTGNIRFDEKWVKTLKTDYKCARFNGINLAVPKCGSSANALLTNLKTLTSNTKRTGASTQHTITSAINRLNESLKGFKHFRSNKQKSLTADELALLRSVYGLDTTKLTDEELSSLSPISITQRTKNQRQEAKKQTQEEANNIGSLISETIKHFKETFQQAKKEQKEKESELETLSGLLLQATELQTKNEHNISLHEELYKDFKLLISAENSIKDETTLANTTLSTNQFAHLSFQIQEIATLIGDKNSGTRKSLKNICSYQCSNHPSSTCYIP